MKRFILGQCKKLTSCQFLDNAKNNMSKILQGVSKNCENPAHTKPLFWIYLLDMQRVVLVDIYLLTFFDNKGVSLLS